MVDKSAVNNKNRPPKANMGNAKIAKSVAKSEMKSKKNDSITGISKDMKLKANKVNAVNADVVNDHLSQTHAGGDIGATDINATDKAQTAHNQDNQENNQKNTADTINTDVINTNKITENNSEMDITVNENVTKNMIGVEISDIKNDKLDLHIKVVILASSLVPKIESEMAEIAKTVNIKGFRVGKVPVSIVKRKYARSIHADVVQNKVSEILENIVKERELNINGQPSVENLVCEMDKDIEFLLKFELMPKIDLPKLESISIEKPVLEVSQKMIDEQLNEISKSYAKYDEESEVASKDGDKIKIDATGYIDGVAFEGGKLEGFAIIIGSKTMIPGFEEQLIGLTKGDTIDINVTFPEDYRQKIIAGKNARFEGKVLSVHVPKIPAIDDKLAKNFNYDNLEQMKNALAKNIENAYNDSVFHLMKKKLFDQLEQRLNFDIPTSLFNKELSLLKDYIANYSEKESFFGGEFDKKTNEEKDQYCQRIAIRRVRLGLMLSEYSKKYNVVMTEEELKRAIIAQAQSVPGQEKRVFDFFINNRNVLESLKSSLMEEKSVRDMFDKHINLIVKKYNEDDLKKLLEDADNDQLPEF